MEVLPLQDRQYVVKASQLLRLARALNLGRTRAVAGVRIRLRDAEVQMTLRPSRGSGVELELWALDREKTYFREVFGRTLSAALA